MTYNSFCETLCTMLSKRFGENSQATLQTVQKNNSVPFDAVCIRTSDSPCSPVVYLRPLFSEHQKGKSVEDLCETVVQDIFARMPESEQLLSILTDFDLIKERICWRLISRDENRDLLEESPWLPFHDLAAVFVLQLESSHHDTACVPIRTSLARLWGKTADDLNLWARENSPRLLPTRITPLSSFMEIDLPAVPPESLSLPELLSPSEPLSLPELFMLTNSSGLYGASSLLYPDTIKDFADQMEADIFILPSSIHEVLLLPDRAAYSSETLAETIRYVNSTAVLSEEKLSDSLYFYGRARGRITRWSPASPDTPSQGGTPNP